MNERNARIYLLFDGSEQGPFSWEEIRNLISEGKIGPTTRARMDDTHTFKPLKSVWDFWYQAHQANADFVAESPFKEATQQARVVAPREIPWHFIILALVIASVIGLGYWASQHLPKMTAIKLDKVTGLLKSSGAPSYITDAGVVNGSSVYKSISPEKLKQLLANPYRFADGRVAEAGPAGVKMSPFTAEDPQNPYLWMNVGMNHLKAFNREEMMTGMTINKVMTKDGRNVLNSDQENKANGSGELELEGGGSEGPYHKALRQVALTVPVSAEDIASIEGEFHVGIREILHSVILDASSLGHLVNFGKTSIILSSLEKDRIGLEYKGLEADVVISAIGFDRSGQRLKLVEKAKEDIVGEDRATAFFKFAGHVDKVKVLVTHQFEYEGFPFAIGSD
jgi:hypothetical protein